MKNCPTCQVPNPMDVVQCVACGEKFVTEDTGPQMHEGSANANVGLDGPGAPWAAMPDATQGQADINSYLIAEKSAKQKRFVLTTLLVVFAIGAVTFYFVHSARKHARLKEIITFYQAYQDIDNGSAAAFWRCTIGATLKDIHKAADTLELTEGLKTAFKVRPKTQPDVLKEKCIPMLTAIQEELKGLKPPADFVALLDGSIKVLDDVSAAFLKYANVIDARKQAVADEQAIRDANNDFHMYMQDKTVAKAVGYYQFLQCLVPDLDKQVKLINKPPDTQPVVQYIYDTCKADVKFAEKIRKECFPKLAEPGDKTPGFKLAAYNMSGDPRDMNAIDDCLERSNFGFSQAELKAIAEAYFKYAEARNQVIMHMDALKKENQS